jgi:glycosyltransferase involved in cell wall biosynthesis
MLKEHFFSLIIPLYNREAKIQKAIQSILDQEFQDFEIIVIDDCSTDRSCEIVLSISDDRIRLIKNETNLERCLTRNKGIELAQGKYICFLDSDDYHLPNHLSLIYSKIISLEEPKAFLFTNSWNETEDGIRTERTCPSIESVDLYTYFLHFTVNPQRWAVEKSLAQEILFDPNVLICEDMDFSLRIVKANYPIYQVNERTTVYVAASDSFTHGDPQKWEKELFYLKRIFAKENLKLPKNETKRLLSMCYFHLARKNFTLQNNWKTIGNSLRSFFLCPKGYNGKTQKEILVMLLYSLFFVQQIRNRN